MCLIHTQHTQTEITKVYFLESNELRAQETNGLQSFYRKSYTFYTCLNTNHNNSHLNHLHCATQVNNLDQLGKLFFVP